MDCTADILGSVVAADNHWSSSPLDDQVKGADDPLRRQREVDLQAQTLSVIVIDDVEHSEASAIRELVVHKVHCPDFIDGLGHSQGLRLFSV